MQDHTERSRNIKVLNEDFEYLDSYGKRAQQSAAAVLRELIQQARTGVSLAEVLARLCDLEHLLTASQATSRTSGAAYRTRLITTEGVGFEDIDRFQAFATFIYLRAIARHLIPARATAIEDEAETELLRLYGEGAPNDASKDTPAP